ncbi:site-specific integrase [Rhodococcus opacus]|uniref:site-specific integrase n=1 Tax=Rhodococcus opacus TaxID=37919 RepID=UPI001C4966B0|nr:tyrosine-type recombinase/integrase [Rhodococcus opacus]MBV6758424.1 tyrosine-type recombinase/integrase [Rhodococcus opacus]
MTGTTSRPRRDAGTGSLTAKHRCGRKLTDGTWPCGKGKPAQCPSVLWVGVLDLGIGGDGKRKQRYVYGRNRNDCATKLRDARDEHESGVTSTSGKATVESWVRHWLDEIAKPQMKPRTWQTNDALARLNILPHVGAHRLAKLSPAHVREMHKAILAAGKSTKTAHNAHTLLSTALTSAVREGLVVRNVAQLVTKPKVLSAPRGALTVEQARQLLVHSAKSGDPMATRWAAALLLGARQGELLGLTWDRVDLDRGIADISWQLQQLPQRHGCGEQGPNGWPCGRKTFRDCSHVQLDVPPGFDYRHLQGALCLTPPKSAKSIRIVPLPDPLLTGLRQLREAKGEGRHSLVWTDSKGGPRHPRYDGEDWKDALRAAGLPVVKLHEARHTTATLLAQIGVEEHVRMQIMGHSSMDAARGYTHIDQSISAAALGKLSQLLDLGDSDGTGGPTLSLVG